MRRHRWSCHSSRSQCKEARYRHINSLFSDIIDWQLIQDHWPELIGCAVSQIGTISSAQLLRRLASYNRRNRLYQAFRELGRVVRTVFLLEYLSNARLREQVRATTNKVEAYNGFAKWLNFGGQGVIDALDPVEQENHLEYNHLVANAAAIQNVIDLTRAERCSASLRLPSGSRNLQRSAISTVASSAGQMKSPPDLSKFRRYPLCGPGGAEAWRPRRRPDCVRPCRLGDGGLNVGN